MPFCSQLQLFLCFLVVNSSCFSLNFNIVGLKTAWKNGLGVLGVLGRNGVGTLVMSSKQEFIHNCFSLPGFHGKYKVARISIGQ
jgi:hypothetical protein